MQFIIPAAIRSAVFLVASYALLLICHAWGGYLLFHVLVELFTCVVLFSIFVVAWNTRQRAVNGYLKFIGLACLFIGAIDLVHTLAYRGMNMLPGVNGANQATQLWICLAAMKAITLLVAPYFVNRRVSAPVVSTIYGLVTAAVLAAILGFNAFPACFNDEEGQQGLTTFKIYAEYVISGLLMLATVLWWRTRAAFGPRVRYLVMASLIMTLCGELVFTLYTQPNQGLNMVGHMVVVLAYYLLYGAIVQTALTDPFALLLNDLQINESTLRKTVTELQLARKEAEDANRAKGQFLAVLSHELRTPLTPVLATVSDMLSSTYTPGSMHEPLAMIQRNVQLQTRIIDDLLDMTRIERGKIRLEKGLADLHESIRHAVETCRPDYQLKGISLETDLAATSTWALADTARIAQVAWNLLNNARKFTPPGGRVIVRTRNELTSAGERFVFEIQDNGAGIAPEAQARIFRAFEQAHDAAPGTTGGLGLGLAISRALIDLHGGSIHVHSGGTDMGATFFARLPTALAPEKRKTPLVEHKASRPLTILLVEDHVDSARTIAQLLRRDGHTVHHANNVATASEAIASLAFDMMITDIGLPDGSGIDVLRELSQAKPDVPAICMSGYGSEQDLKASEAAGSVLHLVKPITLQQLRAAISHAESVRQADLR